MKTNLPHGMMTALAVLFVLALLGGCETPPPTTTVASNARETLTFANGETYRGEMANGLRNGQGTYSWPDGRKYVGMFRNGLPNGQGTYTLPNGEKYVGEFQDNRRAGEGVYTWPDGRKYVGTFRDDKPNGQGTYTWQDGKRYVGEFRNGQANGQGRYSWPDGRTYVGELADDLPNGRGTFTFADGRQQVGLFRNGEFVTAGAAGAASPPVSATALVEVPLERRGGTFTAPVLVNGALSLDFYVDSGAADVSVPANVFEALKRGGTVQPQDIVGSETYLMANGGSKKAVIFNIRSLKVGSVVLENVRGSVSQDGSPPLLGMSFLGRFASWSVDNAQKLLILKPR